MTMQELYAAIGGDYAHAQRIMKLDKMIAKYLGKLVASGVAERLRAAGETLEPTETFEAAHAMKGVCANLGLVALADAVGAVTEEFRPGATRQRSDAEVRALLDEVHALYQRVADGVAQYGEQS